MAQHAHDIAITHRHRVLRAADALALTCAWPMAFSQATGRKIEIDCISVFLTFLESEGCTSHIDESVF